MRRKKASKTAENAAISRAAESLRPPNERVCDDPFAERLISTKYRILCMSRFLAETALWFFAERVVPGAMGEGVVRTRYIDDYLKECIGKEIQQLVILGAGYDSRAYRIEGLKETVKVFEIDHPATQKVKMKRLERLLGSLPGHVVYVPVDFSKEKLDKRLFESGYDRNAKALFIWEGVTYYISAEAVDEVLSFVANNSGPGSSIILDYMFRSVVDGTCALEGAKKHREYVARVGEPFTFGIGEGAIEEFLSKRGFWQIDNATPEFLESTYFTGANQGRKVCPYMPTVHATVKPRG